MRPDLSDDQELFRETTRRFLDDRVPLTEVRALYDHPDGFDRGWWREAAALGWTSAFVPERLGGGSISGRPTTDAVIVAEEMGRLVAPGPFLPVNVVAAVLGRDGTTEQQQQWLPGLLDGTTIATLGTIGDTPDVQASGSNGGTLVLSGTVRGVEAAGSADIVLISAATGTGVVHATVPTGAPGVEVRAGRSIDMTRRLGTIDLDRVEVPAEACIADDDGRVGAFAHSVAIALQCAESVGVADRTLEFTLEYGRDRWAFGRPIVSFQALKHRIADMLTWLEAAKAATDALADAIDHERADAPLLARIAAVHVGRRAADIVEDCVQINGGIGVTWEHDIHLYNRRVVVNRALHGAPEDHGDELFTTLEAAALGASA